MATNDTSSVKLSQHFREIPLSKNHPARCVDGRPIEGLEGTEGGAQMLGGSLLPVVVHAVLGGLPFDKPLLRSDFRTLSGRGFGLGVHRGHHKDLTKGKSDCGFADNLVAIISRVREKADSYASRLQEAVRVEAKLGNVFTDDFGAALIRARQALSGFDTENVRLNGDALIAASEASGATAAEVLGDHAEQAAFVNIDKATTFDTNAANRDRFQGFNLDLVQAMDQSEALGADKNSAGVLSLMLYLATEEVLVEDKGKPALPVVIH